MARVNGRRMVKREPLPAVGVDEQAAAELFDLGGDDVHADSASRRLGDMAGSAEARLQDELHAPLRP